MWTVVAIQYSALASFSFLVYDHGVFRISIFTTYLSQAALSFDTEVSPALQNVVLVVRHSVIQVSFVWSCQWSFGKMLFLQVSYFSMK